MTDPAAAATARCLDSSLNLMVVPLRAALAAIDAGEVTATALEHAYLSGAADALESLLT